MADNYEKKVRVEEKQLVEIIEQRKKSSSRGGGKKQPTTVGFKV
jgi:hypothetical protein